MESKEDLLKAGMCHGEPCFICGHPGQQLCGVCQEVWSCCPAHLLLHNRDGDCYPWRVASREGVGRFLVATRDILAGETIFKVEYF